MSSIKFSPMKCNVTGKMEKQTIVKESDDGVTLKCEGCGKTHGHEIGYFT